MKNIKLLGSEAACGTSSGNGSNFSNSRLVRLVNTGTTVRLVTLETSGNVTIGTFSLVGGEEVFLKKGKTDEIFAASACLLYTSPSPRDDELSRMPSSA